MKEININIEGYNVNGICVCCLNYNRKMYCCKEVMEFYKLISNIDIPDGLTIQVCWECFGVIKTVKKFQQQILKSYNVLFEYSQKYTFLNSPKDLTKHASSKLAIVKLDDTTVNQKDDLGVEVKIEHDNDEIFAVSEPVVGNEVKIEYEPLDYLDDFNSQDAGEVISSEEDVNLLMLKERKHKRERKKSKRKTKSKEEKPKNKMKNLPEDQVELCTMNDEEMIVMRNNDRASEYFQSLKFKCNDCLFGFNIEKLMNDHFEGKHTPKSDDCQKCDICNAYFRSKDISVHRSLHQRAYKCLTCEFKTTLKKIIQQHIRTHTGVKEQFICSICGADVGSKTRLNYHRAVAHREKPQCDCCGKVFANKMTLKYHLKVLPQKTDKQKEKLYLPCKDCNKVFYTRKSYRSHVVIHSGLTYPCPICGKLFQWKRNLARHTRNHRERDRGEVYECRECDKTFSSKDCYTNHLRLSKKHIPPDSYVHVCNYCGKKFSTKYCLVDHIDWEHLKRIKYQCNVCFKAFKTSKILIAHVNNIHSGKKKEEEGEHLCDICGKSYKTEKRLKGHVWSIHTTRSTSKSFKCTFCPATFTWQTSIYKHMKMMHNSKRNKTTRPQVKKEETYPGLELPNRVHYFQQNINLVQNIVQSGPHEVVHNLG